MGMQWKRGVDAYFLACENGNRGRYGEGWIEPGNFFPGNQDTKTGREREREHKLIKKKVCESITLIHF